MLLKEMNILGLEQQQWCKSVWLQVTLALLR